MRVLLDSNVWLAVLTCDGASRAMWRRIRQRVTIIAGDRVYDEVREKLVHRFGFTETHAAKMTRFVRERTRSVGRPDLPRTVCRDADDDSILAGAVAGDCGFLITGDADLLVLGEFEGIKIVKLRQFITILDAEDS